jgi:hypothetical protein
LTKQGISTAPGAIVRRAKARGREVGLAHAEELGGHLVVPEGAAGAAGDRRHRTEPEGEQHRLLQPLVDHPALRPLLRDSRLARIEQGERAIDREADLAPGFRADRIAHLPGALDHVPQIVGHVVAIPVTSPSQTAM